MKKQKLKPESASRTVTTASSGISIPNTLTLTRKEFAAAFRLSLRTVERMIAAGEIQIRHIGPKAVRIPRTEAERYLTGVAASPANLPIKKL